MHSEYDLKVEQKLGQPEYHPAVLNNYDPTSIIFSTGVPGHFGDIQDELSRENHHYNSTAADVSRTIAEIEVIFRMFDIEPQYAQIMRGPDGGVLMFHITPQLEQFEQAVKTNNLQSIPEGYVSWMRRCFGLQSTWFSDMRIIQERQGGAAVPEKVSIVETHEMDTSHEVVLKQGLWANATNLMLGVIRDDPVLNQAFHNVLSQCSDRKGQELLRTMGAQNAAFGITSGAIDLFCMRHPQMTRLAFRDTIQNGFLLDGEQVDFGYRRETDQRFIQDGNILLTLDFVGNQLIRKGLTTANEVEITKEMVRCLLVNKKRLVENYYSLSGDHVDVIVPDYLLVNTLAKGNIDFAKQLKEFCDPHAIDQLMRLCNGLRPMAQLTAGNTSMLHRDVAVGTDGGSNNVLLMKRFNRKQSRIIRGNEKKVLIKQLQQAA